MSEVTYVFGAGASCKSMPLVNNFYERFNFFNEYLRKTNYDRQEFFNLCSDFSKNIKSHLSFDTFFKKLFHQNQKEKILLYKKALLIYFIFEHFVDLDYYEQLTYNGQDSEIKKDYNIDPRYEALIAGLLQPIEGLSEFYSKMNCITWNYDLNLIQAFKNFYMADISYGDFIGRFHISPNEFHFGNQLKVFHLNGFINHNKLINLEATGRNDFLNDFIDDLKNPDFKPLLKFAWEDHKNGKIESPCLQGAVEALKRSDLIVVIGYSFPLYNRLFDRQLFSWENIKRKTIYLQDPNGQDILEILKTDFEIKTQITTKEDPKLIVSRNPNSFIIPSAIF